MLEDGKDFISKSGDKIRPGAHLSSEWFPREHTNYSFGLHFVASAAEFLSDVGEPKSRAKMRVFIQPLKGDSFEKIVAQAVKILHDSNIASTQDDGTEGNFRPAVLIDPADLPDVLEILERVGMRVVIN